jgi:5-methylcytosine-specific restriction endonuclease McrA
VPFDPTLTDQQAYVLGAATVLGTMTGIQGRQTAKEVMKVIGNIKTSKFVPTNVNWLEGNAGGGLATASQKQINYQFTIDVRKYIRDLETRSKIKLHDDQLRALRDNLRSKKYEKLDTAAAKSHKDLYRQPKVKDKLIAEWQDKTGNTWPVYEENIISKNGIVQFEKGTQVQAHHLIHQSHGGPHEWWNIHPLHIKQHQGGVHLKGAPGQIIHGKK